MYCPRCSQEVADETNFCPRCGFYFGVLRELIATGGAPSSPQDIAKAKQPTERQKGMRLGAKMVFFGIALLPIFIGLSIVADGPGPLLVPFTLFLTGVIWMLYARLFREAEHDAWQAGGPPVGMARRPGLLSPSPDMLRNASPPPINTAEIMPPSVTEHTTNFLGPK